MSMAQGGQILLTRVAFNDAREFITAHPGGASVPGNLIAGLVIWLAIFSGLAWLSVRATAETV